MRIGVDMGGTKIEAIALDDDGATVARERILTPSGDYAATIEATRGLVLAIERRLGGTGSVGVGTPGALSPKTGLIKNSNSAVLNGKPLDRDLSAALARPVRLENDANCFALSEAVDGAASHGRVVFGLILGTGVGGGIVVDRKLISGCNRIAGEWGHNPLPWATGSEQPGPQCYCGKRGCIETFLSGPALERQYCDLAGVGLAAQQVAAAADAGEQGALECLGVYRDRLARSLAVVVDILDPDVVVLGGGLSNIAGIYTNIRASIEAYAFSDGLATEIVRAWHGDSSGVRGAAWLWPADCAAGPVQP
jgi:fructokinase